MCKEREIKLTNGFNFRDIGGYKTKNGVEIGWHKIVRGAYLSDLSIEDQYTLINYGIKNVIDLRSNEEVAKYPDKISKTINYIRIPILAGNLPIGHYVAKENGVDFMLKVYNLLVTEDQSKQAYNKVFNELSNIDGCTLIHCSSGKDRTGVVIFLLLKLLGICDDTLRNDYLLTNKQSALHINTRLNEAKINCLGYEDMENMFAMSVASSQYYSHMVKTIRVNYGNLRTYLFSQLHLSKTLIKKLREKYLI